VNPRASQRTRRCSEQTIAGRRAKALEFWQSARDLDALADSPDDRTDAYISLCVLAGIAAADVICCKRLGEHSDGENHNEAIAMLARVDRKLSRHLKALLDRKTSSGYRETSSGRADKRAAGRAAQALVDAALEIV